MGELMRLVCWVRVWLRLLLKLGEGREDRACLAPEGILGSHWVLLPL